MQVQAFFSILVVAFSACGASAQDSASVSCGSTSAESVGLSQACSLTTGAAGTRPLTAAERESHVFFAAGGAVLSSAALAQLEALVRVLSTGPMRDACLKLEGHADATGTREINMDVSFRRAEAVANYLSSRIENPTRIQQVLGVGDLSMLAGFRPSASEHRRVAILARKCS